MTEVKTIKCEIHCQNGESIHAAFPAVPGWMPVWSDPAEYASGCIEKGKANSGIPSNSSEPGENHGNVYAQ